MAAYEGRWSKLRPELSRRLHSNEPVKTLVQGIPNTIMEVGEDYVIVRSSRGGKPRRICADEINNEEWPPPGKSRIILALRKLADRLT